MEDTLAFLRCYVCIAQRMTFRLEIGNGSWRGYKSRDAESVGFQGILCRRTMHAQRSLSGVDQ